MTDVERLLQRIKKGHSRPAIKDTLLETPQAKLQESLPGKQVDFEGMFNQALEEINSRYESGTIPYIRVNYPALWQEIVGTESRLSNLWLIGDAEGLKKALAEWKKFNLEAVAIFRERGKQESLFNFDKGGGEKNGREKERAEVH